jgi:heptaprenyl diphosphate synthase
MDIRKTVRLSMLLALSIVLSLIESYIPIIGNIIPGVKLGIANAVVILVIYLYSFKDALFLSVTRVILVGMIRTGLINIIFMFSLAGALFSITFMTLAKRYTKLSIIGVSIIGAIMHSVGQILVIIIHTQTLNIIYFLPVLLFFSIPTGIIVGMAANEVIKIYKDLNYNK